MQQQLDTHAKGLKVTRENTLKVEMLFAQFFGFFPLLFILLKQAIRFLQVSYTPK